MSSDMLQQRELNMLGGDVCMITPLPEIDQLVYLSHGSTAYHPYIQETDGESHQPSSSTSTMAMFRTDFSNTNDITITIRTKTRKRIKFSVQIQPC